MAAPCNESPLLIMIEYYSQPDGDVKINRDVSDDLYSPAALGADQGIDLCCDDRQKGGNARPIIIPV